MIYNFLFCTFGNGWHCWIVRTLCVLPILFIGVFRIATDAQFVFASLVVLPVLVFAWIDGKRNGLFMAILASATWVGSDIFSEHQYSAAWIPWVNALTYLITYSLVALLVAQIRLQFEREHERATLDVLTGLYNRRAFLEGGTFEIERTKRYKHSLAVLILDLDNFKYLNDTKGHASGDAALRATAVALRSISRSTDRVARLGGDEFSILLLEIGYEQAVEAGQRISSAVNSALQEFTPVKSSIGIAWFNEADRSFLEMLHAADELMYEVKKNGKDDLRSQRFA